MYSTQLHMAFAQIYRVTRRHYVILLSCLSLLFFQSSGKRVVTDVLAASFSPDVGLINSKFPVSTVTLLNVPLALLVAPSWPLSLSVHAPQFLGTLQLAGILYFPFQWFYHFHPTGNRFNTTEVWDFII